MDKNKLIINTEDKHINPTQMKSPMTLEHRSTMIKASYFDINGDFVIDLRIEFLVNKEVMRVLNKQFKISQDDAWGMTLDERRQMVGVDTGPTQRWCDKLTDKTEILSEERGEK